MQYRLVTIIALLMLALCGNPPAGLAQQKKEQPKQSNEKSADRKAEASSLTGCVDEQDGKYVLIHDQTRDLIATLEADGFPAEGFARHLGHKVTVRGTSSPGGANRPVFKVRSVDSLSDSCGSQEL
jgi:hypothetical protein